MWKVSIVHDIWSYSKYIQCLWNLNCCTVEYVQLNISGPYIHGTVLKSAYKLVQQDKVIWLINDLWGHRMVSSNVHYNVKRIWPFPWNVGSCFINVISLPLLHLFTAAQCSWSRDQVAAEEGEITELSAELLCGIFMLFGR